MIRGISYRGRVAMRTVFEYINILLILLIILFLYTSMTYDRIHSLLEKK